MAPQSTSSASVSPVSSLPAWLGLGALSYYRAAWQVVRRDPLLVLWKIWASLFWRGVVVGLAVGLVVLLVAHFELHTLAATGESWGARLRALSGRPGVAVGLAGVLAVGWCAALLVDALVRGGIWGTYARGVRGEPVVAGRTFFEHTVARLDAALGLCVLSQAAYAGLAMLGVSIVVMLTRLPAVSELGVWTKAGLWAAGLAPFLLFAALVRFTLMLTAAPVYLEGRDLGDALLCAAEVVVARLLDVYRVFITYLGLLLIPLFVYWSLLMLHNVLVLAEVLVPLALALRFAGEVVLFSSIAALSVLMSGAMFAFYGEHRGLTVVESTMSHENDTPGPGNQARRRSRRGGDPRRPDQSAFVAGVTLDDLLPTETPNVVDYDQVFAPDFIATLDGEASDAADEAPGDEDETHVSPADENSSDDRSAAPGEDGSSDDPPHP